MLRVLKWLTLLVLASNLVLLLSRTSSDLKSYEFIFVIIVLLWISVPMAFPWIVAALKGPSFWWPMTMSFLISVALVSFCWVAVLANYDSPLVGIIFVLFAPLSIFVTVVAGAIGEVIENRAGRIGSKP
jgi:hypothetical protein